MNAPYTVANDLHIIYNAKQNYSWDQSLSSEGNTVYFFTVYSYTQVLSRATVQGMLLLHLQFGIGLNFNGVHYPAYL